MSGQDKNRNRKQLVFLLANQKSPLEQLRTWNLEPSSLTFILTIQIWWVFQFGVIQFLSFRSQQIHPHATYQHTLVSIIVLAFGCKGS